MGREDPVGGRLLAGLIRRFRSFDVAEDGLHDAYAKALQRWPVDGVPNNPAGWIATVAQPDPDALQARLAAVMAVIYLVFNEGYAASAGSDLLRPNLCAEAIRLGRLLRDLIPQQPDAGGRTERGGSSGNERIDR